MAGPVRVLVVDDDVWVRSGRAAALEACEEVLVVGACSHTEASERTDWDGVDVLLVDAHDPTADFDRFAGVGVVERARQARGRGELRIVVLTGHAANDLLRVRMAEAGADEMRAHADVMSVDALVELLLHPAEGLGVDGDGSHVNDAVRWAEQHVDPDALEHPSGQKALPVSRRRLITARRRISELADLPSPAESPTGQHRHPPWRDVAGFLQRARGADRRQG